MNLQSDGTRSTGLPQVIELTCRRKDGTVHVVPYDFGERVFRDLPGWVAVTAEGYFAIYDLVDAETRLYVEQSFGDLALVERMQGNLS
jgi:hypothetical protein